jgi:mono/diheme cytochrome c family protein
MVTKTVPCPSCDVNLKVPSSVPAGKRIKCPRCETAFALPGDDEDDLDRPARRRSRDEEDEREERPAPRKPRKKAKRAASKAPLIVGLLGGGVILLGAGVALAVAFWPGKKKTDQVASSNTPVPWPMGPGPIAPSLGGQPEQAAAGAGSADDGQPFAAGRRVFQANRCARCHSIGGDAGGGSGPMGARGRKVDLGKVGADPSHTVEWISEHLRDPKAHRPDSRMPGFGKIQPQDLRDLAEYLASLK